MATLENLFCWSLSARDGVTASLRETASLPEDQVQRHLTEWTARLTAAAPNEPAALMFLGTCHRVELYGHGEDPGEALSLWENSKGTHFVDIKLKVGVEALEHLVRVASSLESEVLGETQIMGQMKQAAMDARQSNNLRGPLDWAIQQALRVAKHIRHSTTLGEGVVSVAHVAVDGLADVFDDLETKSALVVGAGSMALQALQRLQRRGVMQITWVNRTQEKIQNHPLAVACRVAGYESLPELVWQHSIVILATSSQSPLLTLETLKEVAKRNRKKGFAIPAPRVLLDLGLPRNIDENIHGFQGFYVRNVDEFSNRVTEHSNRRRESIEKAEQILRDDLAALLRQAEAKERAPLLVELKNLLNDLKSAEWSNMKLEKSEDLEYVSRAINSKLLHRLIGELDQVGEPLASQILETLVKAWRHPDQWLRKDPQIKNLLEKNPAKKLAQIL